MSLGVWIAAGLTLAIYSGVYKENPVYRLVEHIYVGIAAGNGFVMTYDNYLKPTITIDIMQKGRYLFIIPVIVGILIYARFLNNKQVSWLSRIPLSFWIGIGSAVVITKEFKSFFLDQVIATFLPLVGKTPMDTFNNILLVYGVVATLVYFFFAVKQTGPIGWTARAGRYMMMIAFGAAYGNTVMARISLLLGRLQFLLGNWLQIISTRV